LLQRKALETFFRSLELRDVRQGVDGPGFNRLLISDESSLKVLILEENMNEDCNTIASGIIDFYS
jgi:hypothetical protein